MTVVVVGAGAAGCAATWHLRSAGIEVVLLEREDRPGGRSRKLPKDGFEIDMGAVFITRAYTSVLRLIAEMGRADELHCWTPTIAFRRGSEVRRLRPASTVSAAQFGRTAWRSGPRIALDLLRSSPHPFDLDEFAAADDGISTASWGTSVADPTSYQFLVKAVAEPLWGASAEDIPAAATRGALRRGLGAGFLIPPGGVSSICEWLSQGEIATEAEVTEIKANPDHVAVGVDGRDPIEAKAVIIATDAPTAAAILTSSPGTAEALNQRSYSASLHVAIAFDDWQWPDQHDDAVFWVEKGEPVITSIAPQSRREPPVAATGTELIDIYFGDRASRELGEKEATVIAIDSVKRHLGVALPRARIVTSVRHRNAISVPRPGELAQRRPLQLPAGVFVAGDHVSMGSMETAVRSGERAAREVQRYVDKRS